MGTLRITKVTDHQMIQENKKTHINRTLHYLFPIVLYPWVKDKNDSRIEQLRILGAYLWDNEFKDQARAGEALIFLEVEDKTSSAYNLPGFLTSYIRTDGRHMVVLQIQEQFHNSYGQFLRSRYSLMMNNELANQIYKSSLLTKAVLNGKFFHLFVNSAADVISMADERRRHYLADIRNSYGVRIRSNESIELDADIRFCDNEILYNSNYPDICGCQIDRKYPNKASANDWHEKFMLKQANINIRNK